MARDMSIEQVDEVFIVEEHNRLVNADGTVHFDFYETRAVIGRKNAQKVVRNTVGNGENTYNDNGRVGRWTTRIRQIFPVVRDYTYDGFLEA